MRSCGISVCVDREIALRGEIDLARVAHVQLVQLRADLAPDACLFTGVFDEGRTEPLEAMAAAKVEQFPAPLDVGFVAQAGMPGLELQLSCFRRT